MITHKNLFDRLCSLENLRLAYKKARKGKTKKWYVRKFESDLEAKLIDLRKELETQTYKPRPLKRFVIRDPKTRVIHASAFRDRVVHHAICNLIGPVFEKGFIHDTYANRKDKGTHAALRRLDVFERKVTKNGRLVINAKDGNMVVGYALKADIKHYFSTVDHGVLMEILGKRIKDGRVLWLIRTVLDGYETDMRGKGMPLGNMTSQFFANVYLSGLDYFVKHTLKAKYYIRYVDDFVILHRSKEKLMLYKWMIGGFLARLKLELHPEKSKVAPLHNGLSFLGFRFFYHYKLPRRNNMRKLERKLGFEIYSGTGSVRAFSENVKKFLDGWFGYAMHGNTYKLRKRIIERMQTPNSRCGS